ncbi:MAG: primosomal replication protein N [Betaproteobacteria bacterium]|nr:primosomal replication protein N [Betaproteobacteria bacterium]MBI3936799.1 primosomal replication protein N [Betaproteobacteria bacterium]
MESNQVELSGELADIEPLRYTPAGIPLLSFRLAHRSRQVEAGFKRQVECEIAGVAMAEVAVAMSRLRVGSPVRVSGFLNRKNRMSSQLVLHVSKADSFGDTDHGKTDRKVEGQG